MKERLTLLLLLYFTLNFSQAFLVGLIADKNINKKKLVYTNEEGKYLIYLPTVHVGKKEYYDSIKKEVDSLRKEGFIVAYESIIFEINKDDFEINAKKARKIVGYNIANINDNNIQSLPKEYSTKNYLLQNNDRVGIVNTDYNVDMTLHNLIEKYELKYGAISLSQCDLQTPLSAKYLCKEKKKLPKYYFTDELRNSEALAKISLLQNKNIIFLYGKGHKFMLHSGFLNNGYELISGKL
ncbi:hypothetical protein CHRY9390_03054 [Chryseobacterium aquaeductus]|uniref:Uncharacterized protein n=1 Tax=Chryseobacterium aquaeductus TaxID=2675056 RepID=A0A9N8MQT2_9FLAO|nr:hypothetical protein [Chryseobacterium aquaeductus]CAA7332332.1 hypothetical protein CHRY9390_03054 [Chryseobacterium potabilaquae]CAD7815868.1 hypothetical protein CHRY9390_03054 [Chryseobacterium aquaeductus]